MKAGVPVELDTSRKKSLVSTFEIGISINVYRPNGIATDFEVHIKSIGFVEELS